MVKEKNSKNKIFAATWQTQIKAGLALWEAQTCIRFVQSATAVDRLLFTKAGG